MIGKLSHVAIATVDLEKSAAIYRDMLGAKVSDPMDLPEHGVTAVCIKLQGAEIELLAPLGENSPIANFLKRNPDGAVHHLCFEVVDIIAARDQLAAQGMRILGEPKVGAHGKPVLFLHPKDFSGTLIELEEA